MHSFTGTMASHYLTNQRLNSSALSPSKKQKLLFSKCFNAVLCAFTATAVNDDDENRRRIRNSQKCFMTIRDENKEINSIPLTSAK